MHRPATQSCTLVKGVIDSGDVCDRWVAKSTTKTAGLVAAGLAVRAADTGRVLMLQRAMSDEDSAAGMWEFPGGCLEPGEDARNAAVREWQEETGIVLPVGRFIGQWRAGVYEGFIYEVDSEADLSILDGRDKVTNPDDPDGDVVEAIVWWNPLHLIDNPSVRTELLGSVETIMTILDGHPVQKSIGSSAVEAIMAENFRPEGYSWVKDASWDGPRLVNPDFIDFGDVDSWAASHEDASVARFRARMKAGEKLKPAILVKEPDNSRLKVIDGHHRVLAARSLGRNIWAYIGTVSAEEGPWSEAHSFQVHHGHDPLNKDAN
jgi:8-oxo-dGTP pyrophosphatase MutT (NUDIX family)